MNKVFVKIFNRNTLNGILRYFLGFVMMIYGLTKIMKTQFVILPFSSWVMPLEELHGYEIAWAFLGYSSWFTILLGFLEFIPAVLLLFRKTHYLGALLLFPVLLNVVLINFALDLWNDTKLISILLLSINLFLLLQAWNDLIKPIIQKIWNYQNVHPNIKREVIFNILCIGLLLFLFGRLLIDYKNQSDFLTGDWFNKKNSIWTVKTTPVTSDSLTANFFRNGNQLFFEPYQNLSLVDKKKGRVHSFKYQLNDDRNSLEILKKGSIILNLNYVYESDSILILRPLKTSGDQEEIILKKRIIMNFDSN